MEMPCNKLVHSILTFSTMFLMVGFVVPFYQDSGANKELIGTWEFLELLDASGKKIDTIKHSVGWEIPKGPLITFRQNGTYSKQFTEVDIDKGKWEFSISRNQIVYYLLLDEKDPSTAFSINQGFAKKHSDGKYYEKITDSVIGLSQTKLVLFEQPNRKRIFQKKK